MLAIGFTTIYDDWVEPRETFQPVFYGFIAGALIIAGVIAINTYDLSKLIYAKRKDLIQPETPIFGITLFFLGVIALFTGHNTFSAGNRIEDNEIYRPVFYGFVAGTLIIAGVIAISFRRISKVIYLKRIEEQY